jgi:protocatechuate 3,4-dioxygenase beta subunit
MFVGMPNLISSESISEGWEKGKDPLMITGTVYKHDGRTPAPGTVIYYWHTDDRGLYSAITTTPKEAIRHGYLRGWVKSDKDGHYTIKTSRPAPYPKEDIAAHIHLSIKEPQLTDPYYADLYFDDDPKYLLHKKRYGVVNRAGTEVLRVLLDNHIQVAEHNIILGMNIPDYPATPVAGVHSGLNIGEDQPSFIPYHAFGADKGSQACPVCKYGRYHGVLFFVGNNPDWQSIKKWLIFLEQEAVKRKQYLKVYFVYGNADNYNKKERFQQLESLGNSLYLKQTALTFVPSFYDKATEVHLNKINPEAENTFIVYKHRVIVQKFVDLSPTKENFSLLQETLDKTRGRYFDLKEPMHH